MAINLRGTVMACKHVVPVMRGQGRGVITNISSIAAAVDYKSVTYKASKAGMIAFSRQLALDCAADGVRVNAILPGYMDTPMAVDTQARRTGRPREEIADAPRPHRAAQGRHGQRLGRGPGVALPRLRRRPLHHRRGAAGGRRHHGPDRLTGASGRRGAPERRPPAQSFQIGSLRVATKAACAAASASLGACGLGVRARAARGVPAASGAATAAVRCSPSAG